MNAVIDEIFQSGVVKDRVGNEYTLHSNVDRREGKFLFELIESDPTICQTLEIGCAYGLSSLYICSALSHRNSPKHTILDPFQNTDFYGIGISNLQRAGFNFFDLIEVPSEFALPQLMRDRANTFDLVFIDGWHTFDHTLLDLFYANRLVKIGGYIVVDDCHMASVSKAVSYFSNYPAYQVKCQSQPSATAKGRLKQLIKTFIPPAIAGFAIPQYFYDRYYIRTLFSSMVALQKVAEDDRSWNWFHPF